MGSGEATTVITEKYFSSRFCANQFGAGSIEVALKGFLGRLAKKNEPLFVSFSYNTGATSRQVELFDSKGEDFGSAETGGVKKLE
jgi:hypothetical protein